MLDNVLICYRCVIFQRFYKGQIIRQNLLLLLVNRPHLLQQYMMESGLFHSFVFSHLNIIVIHCLSSVLYALNLEVERNKNIYILENCTFTFVNLSGLSQDQFCANAQTQKQ